MFREVNSGFVVKRPGWCRVGSLDADTGTKLRVQDMAWGVPWEKKGRETGLGCRRSGTLGEGSTKLWPRWGQLWSWWYPPVSRVRWEYPGLSTLSDQMWAAWGPGALCSCPGGLTVLPAAGQQAGSGQRINDCLRPLLGFRLHVSGSATLCKLEQDSCSGLTFFFCPRMELGSKIAT